MLAYETLGDAKDEYLRIGKSTVIESMSKFCRAVWQFFATFFARTKQRRDNSHHGIT
jgi:hypothetical protein